MRVLKNRPNLSNRVDLLVQQVALLFTIIFIIYGLLPMWGVVDRAPLYIGNTAVVLVSILWVVYSGWQFKFARPRLPNKRQSLSRIIIFHVFAGIYLLGIIDIIQPPLYLWSLLIVASYLYLGSYGVLGSIGLLYGLVVISLMTGPYSFGGDFLLLNSALIATGLGLIMNFVIRSTETDQQEVDRSRAQVSLQQDRTLTLINNLADAVITTDRFGTITLYNAAALNLLDTNTDMLGQNVDKILSIKDEDDQKLSCWELLHQATTVTTRDDIITEVGDDRIRLEITYSPIRGNYSADTQKDDHRGYVLILRDITKSKSLEEERDEFISVVSHELRTPITIAEGTISNVELMMTRETTPRQRLIEGVAMAHDQVVFLARMVNDLSTLSRAERGIADEAEEIDLDELIHDLYNEYRDEASKKSLTFDLQIHGKAGQVMASRLYLKELLQNFVTNAIKYTHEGGVTIKVRKTSGIIKISVKDTGIGISQTDQKHIFDKFYRAEDYRTRETNGTGLGLYVANKLAKKLGTTIDIASRLNHGSTFSIELPAHSQPTSK